MSAHPVRSSKQHSSFRKKLFLLIIEKERYGRGEVSCGVVFVNLIYNNKNSSFVGTPEITEAINLKYIGSRPYCGVS